MVQLEFNNIICGDSAKVLSTFPEECIDLTVTSPPYDNLRTYNGYVFDFQEIARQLYRVTKVGGVVVWIVSDATIDGEETGSSFRQALYFKEIGFRLHDTMIWNKSISSFPDKVRYYNCFEYMFILSKGRPKTVNLIADHENKWVGTKIHGTSRGVDGKTTNNKQKGDIKKFGVRYNIWNIFSERRNRTGHPAVFPKSLAADHIITWSNPGDVVLDPFCGSGTTLGQALKLHRNFIGIDISEDYCEISKREVSNAVL